MNTARKPFEKDLPASDKRETSNPDEISCQWIQSSNGVKTALRLRSGSKFAGLLVDPASPNRILPQSLRKWASPAGIVHEGKDIWTEGEGITEGEAGILLLHTVGFLETESRKATAVILDDQEGWEAWKGICDGMRTHFESIQLMPKLDWERACNEAIHDKAPFGEALMNKVAAALRDAGEKRGLHYKHPYYCGQGLIFSSGKFRLVAVDDGSQFEILREWDSESGFVSYFSSLNDYICSGADASNALFRTDVAWEMANQRLTRQRLVEYAREILGAPDIVASDVPG